MLLQTNYNNWQLPQFPQLNKFFNNGSLAKFLQSTDKKYIENKNQIFPKRPHIHLRACDATSLYRFPSLIVGQNITK